MEYVQMTLDDWIQIKENLRRDLNGVAESFVRIGYSLRRIKEEKLYERDGYPNMEEFARKEYGLSASTVSRFIAINKKYSIDGYSEQLRPEFIGMGSAKLSEMLTLPENDIEMIRPETTREQIRDLKDFDRQMPEGTAELMSVIKQFYLDNRDVMEEIYQRDIQDAGQLAELVNPSGNRSYRKGLFFLMMYEDGIKVKQHGKNPETVSWDAFLTMTWVFLTDYVKESPVNESKDTQESAQNVAEIVPEPKVAPAQEVLVNTRKKPDFGPDQEDQKTGTEEQIPGQMNVADYPGVVPEAVKELQDQVKTLQEQSERDKQEADQKVKAAEEAAKRAENAAKNAAHSSIESAQAAVQANRAAEIAELDAGIDPMEGSEEWTVTDWGVYALRSLLMIANYLNELEVQTLQDILMAVETRKREAEGGVNEG